MNTRHAQYILTIAGLGSITAAARELYISQPALSQTIKAVESDIGAPIFERRGKKLSLTPIGQKYVENMRVMLSLEKNLLNEIDGMKQQHSATLRLGIPTQRTLSLLPRILPEFIEKYPFVSVEIIEMPSLRLEELLLKGGCDVALITTNVKQNDIVYRLLENENVILAASKRTKLSQRVKDCTEIELSEAANEKFLNLAPGHSARAIQDRLAEYCGIRPKVLLEMQSLEAVKLLLPELDAVMVCPYVFIRGDGRVENRINRYPLRCHGFERHLYFCYQYGLHMKPYIEYLYEISKEKVQEHIQNNILPKS